MSRNVLGSRLDSPSASLERETAYLMERAPRLRSRFRRPWKLERCFEFRVAEVGEQDSEGLLGELRPVESSLFQGGEYTFSLIQDSRYRVLVKGLIEALENVSTEPSGVVPLGETNS